MLLVANTVRWHAADPSHTDATPVPEQIVCDGEITAPTCPVPSERPQSWKDRLQLATVMFFLTPVPVTNLRRVSGEKTWRYWWRWAKRATRSLAPSRTFRRFSPAAVLAILSPSRWRPTAGQLHPPLPVGASGRPEGEEICRRNKQRRVDLIIPNSDEQIWLPEQTELGVKVKRRDWEGYCYRLNRRGWVLIDIHWGDLLSMRRGGVERGGRRLKSRMVIVVFLLPKVIPV